MKHLQIGNHSLAISKQPALLLVSFVVLIVVILCLTIARPAITNQLRDWKVLPAQEALTELYFFDHLRLPSHYTPDQPQEVAFTIRNFEGSDQAYAYRLVAVAEDSSLEPTQLADGSLTLANNAARTVQQTIVIPDIGTRVRIEVHIYYNNNNQSISYWTERTS